MNSEYFTLTCRCSLLVLLNIPNPSESLLFLYFSYYLFFFHVSLFRTPRSKIFAHHLLRDYWAESHETLHDDSIWSPIVHAHFHLLILASVKELCPYKEIKIIICISLTSQWISNIDTLMCRSQRVLHFVFILLS